MRIYSVPIIGWGFLDDVENSCNKELFLIHPAKDNAFAVLVIVGSYQIIA